MLNNKWILKVWSTLKGLFFPFFYNTSLYLINWRRQWHPTPVLLPGKSHGQRSLVGCSPWGRWESGTTERLHFHFSLSCIGEGNGNPLQCSCLENPRDRLPSLGSHRVGHDWSDLAAAVKREQQKQDFRIFNLAVMNRVDCQSRETTSNDISFEAEGKESLNYGNGREKWKWKSLSCFQLFATAWTTQSMEFSRPEYWSG